MKRFLSILLSVLMVVSVLAILASCNGQKGETTTAATQVDTTAGTTAKTDTTTEQTTTQATVTTTEAVVTTTQATVTTTEAAVTTTEAAVTTTEAVVTTTEETTTTAEVTTTAKPVETTTLPVFARFDFGTKTYAEEQGLTSHDYLMEALEFDSDVLYIDFKDDYWDIYTVSGLTTSNGIIEKFGTAKNFQTSLIFNDLVQFEFDDDLTIGWGGFVNQPYIEPTETTAWQGMYQYMQIRVANNTTNNIWSMRYRSEAHGAFSTTQVISNLYLQGGEPTSSTDLRRECTPTTEFSTFTYDLFLHSGLSSGRGQHPIKSGDNSLTNWFDYKAYVYEKGAGGTNLTWQTKKNLVAVEFNLFSGLYLYGFEAAEYKDLDEESAKAISDAISQACDTRANIKNGMNVKVDYIIFGCSPEQLDAYKSKMEQGA